MYFDELKNIIKEENIVKNAMLKDYCTFKIGGECEYLLIPENEMELKEILSFARSKSIDCLIIGNGSNILFSDSFRKGFVIVTSKLNEITVNGEEITAMCGARLSSVCSCALKSDLTGMECLNGIPGTVGGGVYMNAGAYGSEMKDVVIKTTYLDENLNICELYGEEHEFSYRHSFFSDKNDIILKSVFQLKKGTHAAIKAKMQECIDKRNQKQPLEYPNAGSTFKRPEGYFAGKLIEDCGLKGYCIGDACVSDKHSGFVINKGNASCDDVKKLISHIKNEVKDKFGVDLETEVKYF